MVVEVANSTGGIPFVEVQSCSPDHHAPESMSSHPVEKLSWPYNKDPSQRCSIFGTLMQGQLTANVRCGSMYVVCIHKRSTSASRSLVLR